MSELKPFSDRAGCKLYHETVVDMLEARIEELEAALLAMLEADSIETSHKAIKQAEEALAH